MKRFFLLILLLMPVLLFGQNKKRFRMPVTPTKKQLALAVRHNQCYYQNKYSTLERRTFFPFSTADTIKLISYKAEAAPNAPIYDDEGKYIDGDTTKYDTVPLLQANEESRFVMNKRKVKEIKTLTSAGVDSITNILFNFGYTPVKNLSFEYADLGATCYEPRNAVLFIDKEGNIIQYLEICFGCQHHFWSSSKVADIEYCDNKYELLRRYFLAEGVKYGADPKTLENE